MYYEMIGGYTYMHYSNNHQYDWAAIEGYAHSFAKRLIERPFNRNVLKICIQIINLKIDDRAITDSELLYLLDVMEADLDGCTIISESFDNRETLSLMAAVRKEIERAKGGKQ